MVDHTFLFAGARDGSLTCWDLRFEAPPLFVSSLPEKLAPYARTPYWRDLMRNPTCMPSNCCVVYRDAVSRLTGGHWPAFI